ncbi:MAG: response regulator transcription factor [Acidimicrobiales bacterium]|nr:response regulator transcription factor [Acidimicrobiales bacterium]
MRVLLVDDDPGILLSVRRALEFEGYTVPTATDGVAALAAIAADRPDAVVLDVTMPRLDGLAVCRELRGRGDRTPILVLTARHAVADRVAGLDAGADDYLVKPFALEELLARVRALLRRQGDNGAETGGEQLVLADLVMDVGAHQVRRAGHLVELTRTEWSLLELLLRNAGQVLTREVISDRVWGYDFGTASSLDVYIGYLRRKTEEHGGPRLLQTVRGVGFVAREQPG